MGDQLLSGGSSKRKEGDTSGASGSGGKGEASISPLLHGGSTMIQIGGPTHESRTGGMILGEPIQHDFNLYDGRKLSDGKLSDGGPKIGRWGSENRRLAF